MASLSNAQISILSPLLFFIYLNGDAANNVCNKIMFITSRHRYSRLTEAQRDLNIIIYYIMELTSTNQEQRCGVVIDIILSWQQHAKNVKQTVMFLSFPHPMRIIYIITALNTAVQCGVVSI